MKNIKIMNYNILHGFHNVNPPYNLGVAGHKIISL
jgi:hypothetical protein